LHKLLCPGQCFYLIDVHDNNDFPHPLLQRNSVLDFLRNQLAEKQEPAPAAPV